MDKHNLKRLFVIGIISSLTASAAIGIIVILKGSFDDTDWKILATTLAVGLFSITSLANLRNLDAVNSNYRSFASLSIMLSIAAFLSVGFLIWVPDAGGSLWKLVVTLSVLAISSAHASLLLPLRQKGNGVQLLVTLTMLFIGLVAFMIIYLVFDNEVSAQDYYFRILGVFAILDVLGTIISPITARFIPVPAQKKSK